MTFSPLPNPTEGIQTINKLIKDPEKSSQGVYAPTAALTSDRAWAEAQAQKQMDFQERMSNTAYQRAVEDLRKAGLNPALAFQTAHATTPSGSQAGTPATAQSEVLQSQRLSYSLVETLFRGIMGIVGVGLKSV